MSPACTGKTMALALLAALALPPASAAPKSDDWCADAVDFAMGVAQNREAGYTLELITGSVERNPDDYRRMFRDLSGYEMKQIAQQVYDKEWSRFRAAQGVAESCELAAAPN
ncbi:MAG: hypothetical protein M3O62_01325 [Pseudomonadota bacterium]|nr:hypothetical protein [Pseudomonadota bacterium]